MSTSNQTEEKIEDIVGKIAELSRLSINSEEIPAYQQQLGHIIQFVKQLDGVGTENVEPMAHPQDQCQRLRADSVTESDQHKYFQENAPLVEAGLYLVPKVIEKAEE